MRYGSDYCNIYIPIVTQVDEEDEENTQSFAQMSLMKQKTVYRPSLRGAVKRRTKQLSKQKTGDNCISHVCKQSTAGPTYSDNEKEDPSVTTCMRTISSHPEIEVLNDITYFTSSDEQQSHKSNNTLSLMTSHELEMEVQVAEIILQ